MANITGGVTGNVSLTQTPSSGFLNSQALALQTLIKDNFQTAGTNADQVNLVHAKTYSFTASNAQTIDLRSLTDIFGSSITIARAKVMAFKIKSTTDGATLTVATNATNGMTSWINGSIKVHAKTNSNDGGIVAVAPNTTGWVTAANAKDLLLTPSAHAFDVDIVIAGCDA